MQKSCFLRKKPMNNSGLARKKVWEARFELHGGDFFSKLWSDQNQFLFNVDRTTKLPVILTDFLSERFLKEWIRKNPFEWQEVSPEFEGREDDADAIESEDVLELCRATGCAVIEIALYKNGRKLPDSRQPKFRFWVIKVDTKEVLSVHATLGSAHSELNRLRRTQRLKPR